VRIRTQKKHTDYRTRTIPRKQMIPA